MNYLVLDLEMCGVSDIGLDDAINTAKNIYERAIVNNDFSKMFLYNSNISKLINTKRRV